ncbi:MAG: CocE/NonD family hydrolase [Actinomycetia bacterium]|nr:CocE/NonD family hydrolase [Actinomycetes bacterium]
MREEQAWVVVRDGVRIAVSVFRPAGDHEPAPALLEALPYRKDDLTASYRNEYRRLCDEHGYVVARADVRGTGSSTGIATDEYPPEEQADLAEVIAWLAAQPWCTGAVGMYGTSYSGFNSLQLAAERPPALHAVCAIYATDDRYTDDVHYTGGSLRGLDLLDYVLYMTAMNALPPVPAVFGDGWRDEWRARVERTEPWMLRWLRDQVDGPNWRQGSLRRGVRPPESEQGYERIDCAVMIVAGWADGYRNNTFRTFARLRGAKRLLIGPWAHQSPATAHPGPHVDLVVEMARWFDHHLRGRDTGVQHEPPIQVFMRHATHPLPDLAVYEGAWRAEETWPPARLEERELHPNDDSVHAYVVEGDVGTTAWISCAGYLPWGQPSDQRTDDARSLTFDWPVDTTTEVLGHARVQLRVRADAPVVSCSVKLCDVFPDGTSALVTRGYLNLTHRRSSTDPEPLVKGEWYDIEIELEATSWVFEPRHRIRLALAGTDWPNIWAPPAAATLEFDAARLTFTLPVLAGPPPVGPPSLAVPSVEPGKAEGAAEGEPVVWRVEHDVLEARTRCVVKLSTRYETPYDARVLETYTGDIDVLRTDPAHGNARTTARYEIAWPDLSVTSEARLMFSSDATSYHVHIELDVEENGHEFARRRWTETIPRNLQ